MPEPQGGIQSASKRKVGRSPAYPAMSVQRALEKVAALHAQEGDYAAPLPSVAKAWGYSTKSSGARQALATLKYYGLIDVTGDGDSRKIKVTDTARRILLDKREDETEKWQLIRKVALAPTAHKTLFEQYPTGLASDGSVTHFLMFDAGFNPEAAAELLAEFKETARQAAIYQPENVMDKEPSSNHSDRVDNERPEVRAGDKIQWTSGGVEQFRDGGKVLGFSDDGQWVFTDQGTSGVPIGEVSIMERPADAVTPPQMPAHLAKGLDAKNNSDIAVRAGSRKAVFPVEEGDVTLIFPEDLSADGLAELGLYLDIFLKKEQKNKVSAS